MTYPRIDPKTRRLIVSDLTPPHKNKTKGVHGVDEILSKSELDDYKDEAEALNFITSRVVKSILFSLWQNVDWDAIDLWAIDWEEWIEPVLRSGEASEPFDWNNQNLKNVKKLNISDPTELTILSGAITVTRGYHTVDTEGDAAADDLDTINGGSIGDVIFLAGANDAREVILTRAGNIRFKVDHSIEGFSFSSPTGSSGTYYTGGYYRAPAAETNLDEVGATQAYGTANSPYGAHAFLVAKEAGSVNAGSCSIVVSGTSIADDGTRTALDSETLVADITAMTTDAYYETVKKWIGQVVYTLTPVGAATYSADFNYGLAAYDSFSYKIFTLKAFEVMGRAGANDAGFDLQLLHHKCTGWTYSAANFSPGTTPLCSLATDYSTESDLKIGERFKYERDLSTAVDGTDCEGFLIKVITTANKAVEFLNASVYAEALPNNKHMKTTNQAAQLLYNGSIWMEV